MPEPSVFERSVAATSIGGGRYMAHVEPAWNGPVAPNGGVLAATMLRAAEAELGPDAPPARTISTHFLDAPGAGAAELEVEVLRRGKRVAAAAVRLAQGERLMCHATVIFSEPRPSVLAITTPAPDVPRWEDVPIVDITPSPTAPVVFRQMEIRPVFGPMIFSADPEPVSGGWLALRNDRQPLDAARLTAMTDLWWPAVFGTVSAPVAVPTLQLSVYLRRTAPAQPPVLARFETRQTAEGHLEETGRIWSQDGELLAESTQLALALALKRP